MDITDIQTRLAEDIDNQQEKLYDVGLQFIVDAMDKVITEYNVPELRVTPQHLPNELYKLRNSNLFKSTAINMYKEEQFQSCLDHEDEHKRIDNKVRNFWSACKEYPFISEIDNSAAISSYGGRKTLIHDWCKYMALSKACKKDCRRCVLEKNSYFDPDDVTWYGMVMLFILNVASRMTGNEPQEGDIRMFEDSLDITLLSDVNAYFKQRINIEGYMDTSQHLIIQLYNGRDAGIVYSFPFIDVTTGKDEWHRVLYEYKYGNDDLEDDDEEYDLADRRLELDIDIKDKLSIAFTTDDCPKTKEFVSSLSIRDAGEWAGGDGRGAYIITLERDPNPSNPTKAAKHKAAIAEAKAHMDKNRERARQAEQRAIENIHEYKRKGALQASDLTRASEDTFKCHNGTRKLGSEEETCKYFLSNDGSKSESYGYEDILEGLGECIPKEDIVKLGTHCYSRNTLSTMFKSQRRSHIEKPYMFHDGLRLRGEPDLSEAELDRLGIEHRLTAVEEAAIRDGGVLLPEE